MYLFLLCSGRIVSLNIEFTVDFSFIFALEIHCTTFFRSLWFQMRYLMSFKLVFSFLFFFVFLPFLGLLLRHMEVPRLGIESELPAYARATATRDPSHICDLHHSSRQCRIVNPLSKAREQTCVLMDPSRACDHWATTGAPKLPCFIRTWSQWIRVQPNAPLLPSSPAKVPSVYRGTPVASFGDAVQRVTWG